MGLVFDSDLRKENWYREVRASVKATLIGKYFLAHLKKIQIKYFLD